MHLKLFFLNTFGLYNIYYFKTKTFSFVKFYIALCRFTFVLLPNNGEFGNIRSFFYLATFYAHIIVQAPYLLQLSCCSICWKNKVLIDHLSNSLIASTECGRQFSFFFCFTKRFSPVQYFIWPTVKCTLKSRYMKNILFVVLLKTRFDAK